MTYFDKTDPQETLVPAYRRPELPVAVPEDDADDDRIYTEEDYALPQDGDAFLPDEEEFYPEPFDPPTAAFSYAGSYDSLLDTQDEQEDFFDEDLDDLLTEEDRLELRRGTWKTLASVSDFIGVILGTAAILLLVALLASLLNWLVSDISQTFTLWQLSF